MLKPYLKTFPQIDANVFVDDSAVIIGDVVVGEDSSIWPLVVLRGDVNAIKIGERTSIQDGSVIHVTHKSSKLPQGYLTQIGSDVTIGHRVILHGCTLYDRCLIGMGSCVMDGAVIESDVILGAGSLVPPQKTLKGGHLWLGSPVRCARPLTSEEIEGILYSSRHYVKLKNNYLFEAKN